MNLFTKKNHNNVPYAVKFIKIKDTVIKWGKSNKKASIAILSGLLALIVAIVILCNYLIKDTKTELITGLVRKGNISNSIEGSGTLQANDQYELIALVKGDILADYIEEGQEVKEGDLLYEIDPTDINNSIEKAKANVEKAQLSYNQSLEAVNNLSVKATASGIITNMYIDNGDSVNNGTKICDIVNFESMLLDITFNSNDAKNIFVGENAIVNLENAFSTLTGTVKSVGTGALVNDSGVSVTSVEILVSNPGGIVPGDKATAIVGEYACNTEGTFEYSEEETIVAKTNGEVYGLNYKAGDKISKNNVICRLDSDNVLVSEQQSRLSLKDAQLSLENYYEQLDNYNITAPISGKVIQKNSKAGDTLDNTTNNNTMAIIADLSSLKFTISIDELDITKVKEGQEVRITADAMAGKLYSGYVSNVSIVGSSSNGVTSYPIEVTLNMEKAEGLIPGMNVNANIVIESKQDILMVPVAAVNRGNTILVKGEASNDSEKQEINSEKTSQKNKSSNAPEGMPSADKKPDVNDKNTNEKSQVNRGPNIDVPDGYRLVSVKIGISDGNFVEIVSGDIKEGDTVILTNTATAANASTSPNGMRGGMSMGGGMPVRSGMPMSGGMRR